MHLLGLMNIILNRAVLPKAKSRLEKPASRIEKTINFNLLDNKYLNSNINSILKISNVNLDNLLNNIYENILGLNYKKDNLELAYKGYNKICEIIFNYIKYKNIGGIRLIVSGRLTKRYRAERALYKVKWKGGLNNIDSSIKGLSSVNKRGYLKPNVEYSIFTSKRRIGSFAVKGWISGK